MKSKQILVLLLCLIVSLTACGPSAEEMAATYMAQTSTAEAGNQPLIEQAINATNTHIAIVGTNTPTISPTSPPTMTPTITLTPTITNTPTETPVPAVEIIKADTAIRRGPGTMYKTIIEPEVGETYLVVGQNEEGTWLVIDLGNGEQGWVALEDVSLNITNIQFKIVQPPPTPQTVVTITVINNTNGILRVRVSPKPGNWVKLARQDSYTTSGPPGAYEISLVSTARHYPGECTKSVYLTSDLFLSHSRVDEMCAAIH
ncbi:hypothetical protein ACFLYP_02865 [Chloroflexota bacterium]